MQDEGYYIARNKNMGMWSLASLKRRKEFVKDPFVQCKSVELASVLAYTRKRFIQYLATIQAEQEKDVELDSDLDGNWSDGGFEDLSPKGML